MQTKLVFVFAACFLAASLALCPGKANILATLQADANFTVLSNLIHQTGLAPALQADHHCTLFAPTDAAIAAFTATLPGLMTPITATNLPLLTPSLIAHVQSMILAHLVPGKWNVYKLKDNLVLQTLSPNFDLIRINRYSFKNVVGKKANTIITVNGVPLIESNIVTRNGIIHVIDAVLPTSTEKVFTKVAIEPNLSIFNSLMRLANLTTVLKHPGLTLFAPSNEAFAALPQATMRYLHQNIRVLQKVLLYHILPKVMYQVGLTEKNFITMAGDTVGVCLDEGVKVNDANIITPNIHMKNGVIHIIDQVLFPQDIEISA